MDQLSLLELHSRRNSKVSDKWELYLSIYEELFLPFRYKTGALLEIGVQNGGSLDTWSEYFTGFTSIIGCDIDPKCGNLTYHDPRIKVVVGNATDPNVVNYLHAYNDKFTLIIDDGSHLPFDVIRSFILLFPHLAPGGLYAIEDTHVFYGPVPGGGILNPGSIQNAFKQLTDSLNRQFWQNDVDWRLLFQGLFPHKDSVSEVFNGNWIRSIRFYNSMIVIEKEREETINKLGARMRVGTKMDVQDWSKINQ